MLSTNQKLFRVSSLALLNRLNLSCSRHSSSKGNSKDDIAWSHGEKEKPLVWRHKQEDWYKYSAHLKNPHPFDPNDPKQVYPQKLPDGGIQYHNFVYYPRFPDQEEPAIEPTPLLLVFRHKTTKFRPYWEKKIIKYLNLDPLKCGSVITVVKNTPEMNAMLWQVKHLVVIKPLRIPENLPEDANPLHCFIKESGEMVYNPTIKVTEKDLKEEVTEKTLEKDWVDKQTRSIYNNSLKLEF